MLGLTNVAHSSFFIKSAWKGYSDEIDEKYGFNLALEWYLDSWASSILESKFMCASTCFELLMDKFHTQNNSELILDNTRFEDLHSQLVSQLMHLEISVTLQSCPLPTAICLLHSQRFH